MRAVLSSKVKLHVIVRIRHPEDQTKEKSEPPPCGVMHDGWCGKSIQHAASHKLAAASGYYVSDPLTISSVCKCDQESARDRKNLHRRPIEAA